MKPGVKSLDSLPDNAEKAGNSMSKTVTFKMSMLKSNACKLTNPIGPLLDDGAPYSGMRLDEFQLIKNYICSDWSGEFDDLPDSVRDRPFRRYV